MEMYNKHYIKVDASGRVVDAWSDGPLANKDTTDAILFNEEGGYQLRLMVAFTDDLGVSRTLRTEENPPLFDGAGIPLYKWDGEKILYRTIKEIEADRAELPVPEVKPSDAEKIAELEAKVADQEALINALLWEE